MYDRHIDVKQGLVFFDRVNCIKMDLSKLPKNVTFYVEFLEDWWVEREPFNGREKNEDIKHIALLILEEAKNKFDQQQKEFTE